MSEVAGHRVGPIVAAVLVHPSLWPTAIGQALRLAPSGWWRRPPFLPMPDPGYLAFRLETQYGRDAEPTGADVVSYLRWCRDEARRRGHHVDG